MIEYIKVYKQSIARTAILLLGLINQFLVMSGHEILPISDNDLNMFVTGVITFVTTAQAYWFNNFDKKHNPKNKEKE